MYFVKKLVFIIPYLISLTGFIYYLSPLLASLDVLFAFNLSTIVQMLATIVLLSLAGMFFVIFATLADDIKLVIPTSLICSIIPPLVVNNPYPLYLILGLFLSQVLVFLILKQKLSSYLTFSAHSLLNPSVKHFSILVLLAASVIFYLSIAANIKQNGFQIPDSLLDLSLNLASQQSAGLSIEDSASSPQLTPEQIQLLRKYPDLLEKYGLDPSVLNSAIPNTNTAKQANSATSQLIKPMLENQFQSMIKPYENWIAPAITVIFFLTLFSISSTLIFLILPLLWVLFWIMEKTGFTKFTTEMREVKKLVV